MSFMSEVGLGWSRCGKPQYAPAWELSRRLENRLAADAQRGLAAIILFGVALNRPPVVAARPGRTVYSDRALNKAEAASIKRGVACGARCTSALAA